MLRSLTCVSKGIIYAAYLKYKIHLGGGGSPVVSWNYKWKTFDLDNRW